MALENLTARERLALDLEHTTENLWTLLDRDIPTAGEPAAPTRAEIAALVVMLRRLDGIGAELAPNLYRSAEQRRGRLDL